MPSDRATSSSAVVSIPSAERVYLPATLGILNAASREKTQAESLFARFVEHLDRLATSDENPLRVAAIEER